MHPTIKREIDVAVHGQSVRFRIVKHAIIFATALLIYWRFGWTVLIVTAGVVFVVALAIHFLFRWRTDGWRKKWGPYTPKLGA